MGKAALVTGSSRGIGKAVILELANSGYRCVVNYNKSEKEAFEVVRKIRNRGGQAIACKADVRDSQEVKNMFLEELTCLLTMRELQPACYFRIQMKNNG